MKHSSLLLAFLVSVHCQAADAPPGSRETYLKNGCWGCHGTVGQGSMPGPRLDTSRLPYEVFSAMVRNPSRAMPPYSAVILPDSEMRLIYGYLQSVSPSPKAADIPLLKP